MDPLTIALIALAGTGLVAGVGDWFEGGGTGPNGDFAGYGLQPPMFGGTAPIPGLPPQPMPQTPQNRPPGQGELTYSPQGWDQTGQGVGEQWWNQQQGRFGSGGSAANFYGNNAQTFAQPGQGEQFWNQVSGGMMAPTATEQVFGQAQGSAAAPGRTEGYADQTMGAFGLPSYSAQYANQTMPGLNAPGSQAPQATNAQSYFDQFAAGPSGMGAYYDRAREQTSEALNNQLAASGLLGSSYGAEAAAGAMADIGAQQAAAEAQYSLEQQALGGQLARGADLGMGQQFQQQLQQQELGRLIAAGADQAEINRLLSGGQLSNMADAQTLARMGLLGDLGMGLDQTSMDRLGLYGDLAFGAQGLGMDRLFMGYDMAQGVDAMDLERAMAGADASYGAQGLNMDRAQAYADNMWRDSIFNAGLSNQWNEYMMQNQMDLFNAVMASELGLGVMGYNDAQRNEDQFRSDVGSLPNWIADWAQLGGSQPRRRNPNGATSDYY